MKFWKFWGKYWGSYLKYFQNHSLRKRSLLKCIARPVSEHPLALNVFTGPKHSRSLHGSTFILLFHHSHIDRTGKRSFLGPFPNRLTADAKYSRHNSGTLLQPIQWHLSENPNIFSKYFIAFLELKLNLKHFGKKFNLLA